MRARSKVSSWLLGCVVLLVTTASEAAVVQGYVKDELGAAVVGAAVGLRGTEVGTLEPAMTDALGFYSIETSADSYRITILGPEGQDWVPERLSSVVVDADATLEDIILRKGVVVSGLVTDSNSLPLVDVDLGFEDEQTGQTIYTPSDDTDASGRYSVLVPPGTYRVKLRPPQDAGLASLRLEGVTIESAGELAAIVLADGVEVSGKLIDENGGELSGIDLDFYDALTGDRAYSTYDDTDDSGEYRVFVEPGVYEIRFTPPAGSRLVAERLFDVEIPEAVRLNDLVIRTGMEIYGRVVDTLGRAVPDVDLDAFEPNGERMLTPRDDTADDGYYRLILPPGTYDLRYAPPRGSRLLPQRVDAVELTGDSMRPDIILEEGWLVSITVLAPDGQPIEDVDLDFIDAGTGQHRFVPHDSTDATGQLVAALPNGNYDVPLAAPRETNFLPLRLQGISVSQDLQLGEVRMELGHAVSALVVNPALVGVADIDVDALDATSGSSIYLEHDETDGTGYFRIVVPGGRYRIRLEPTPEQRLLPLKTRERDVVADLDLGTLALAAGLLVEGFVIDSLGAPVADVDVDFVDGSGAAIFDAVTDDTGYFGVVVTSGSYLVQYTPPADSRFLTHKVGPTSISGDTVLRRVTLETGHAVSGTVVDESQIAVTGVDVDLIDGETGQSVPLRRDETDGLGFFSVLVREGAYQLMLEPAPESRKRPLLTAPFGVSSDIHLGTLVLSSGFYVEGFAIDESGAAIPGVDIDFVDTLTGERQLLQGDLTDSSGHFGTVVAPGEYIVEYAPPASSRWVPLAVGPVTVSQDSLLPAAWLQSGSFVSGVVLGPDLNPTPQVKTRWAVAGSCDPVFTARGTTDATGSFQVVLAAGTYDVTLVPPDGSGLYPERLDGIVVGTEDLLLPTETLSTTPTVLELCDGRDDDCDGFIDEGCDPSVTSELAIDRGGMSWSPVEGATGYDVVRGSLQTMRSADLTSSVTTCLADDQTATWLSDVEIPARGDGFWWLVRWSSHETVGSYGGTTRDQQIEGSLQGCP